MCGYRVFEEAAVSGVTMGGNGCQGGGSCCIMPGTNTQEGGATQLVRPDPRVRATLSQTSY